MRLLLLENDHTLAAALTAAVRTQAFQVEHVTSAQAALALLAVQSFDAICASCALPGMNARLFCERLRASGVTSALLAFNAPDTAQSRIETLNAGADDCLTNAFDIDELLARLRAVMRRCGMARRPLNVGPICIDPQNRVVTVDGADVQVTAREGALLAYLAQHEGAVVSRKDISRNVWKSERTPASNTIDVNIRHLRHKLGDAARYLKTVRGVGYILEA